MSNRRSTNTCRSIAEPVQAAAAVSCCFVLLLLLVLIGTHGCSSPKAAELTGLPSTHELELDRLIVRSDLELSKRDALVSDLQKLRVEVTERLRLPAPKRPVVVYLFKDETRYADYMRVSHPTLPARRAFFIGTATELAVYAFWGDRVREDLRHEYTHGILHAALKDVPLWLDEGLAEYFEVAKDTPGRINQEHADRLALALGNGWQPDLRRLEKLQSVSEMQRTDYQEAWAWVHYLLDDSPDGQKILLGTLADLAKSSRLSTPMSARIAELIPQSDFRLVAHLTTTLPGAPAAARAKAQSPVGLE